MGLELTSEAYDYFFLRLFELDGEKNINAFDYKKIVDEWGRDDDKSIYNFD
jgi:hypothetical protein